jgi:hypothetical protein
LSDLVLCLTVATTVMSAQAILADDGAAKPVKERPKGTARVEKAPAKAQVAVAPKPQAVAAISPDREAAALAFARENHPELASLLDGLKRNAPKEYQAAMTDLDRVVDRLAKSKERSPERYTFELAEWKLTSRIRLLAARLTMSPDPTVEAELRAALRERLELRLSAQRVERDRLQARVNKLDQQIEEMSSKADAIIEKQFVELRKTMPTPKPAAKAKSKKPTEGGDQK